MDDQSIVQHAHWYDAFIAHADADLGFALCLLKDVESKGFKCILAKRDFVAGNPVVENIATAIHRSRRIIMIVSKASLQSEWCKYEMLVAINESHAQNSVKLLPVILEDVADDEIPTPLRFVTYIHMGKDPNYLDKLLNSLSSTDVSWESLLPVGNVAHGLAWSYYYGYLKVILPGIDERIRISKWWNQVFEKRRISQKLFLLFPESCLCRGTLTDDDPHITHAGHLETVIRNRAGTVNRPYKSTVYSITTTDDKELHFVGEYITAIHTMYEMEQEQTSGLNSDDKRLQATQFYITMQDILERDPECRGKYKILYYKDVRRPGQQVRIAEVLSKAIQEEIWKELEIEKHSLGNHIVPQENYESVNIPSICFTSSISMFNMNSWNDMEFHKNEPLIVKDAKGKAKSMEKGNRIINFFNGTNEDDQKYCKSKHESDERTVLQSENTESGRENIK